MKGLNRVTLVGNIGKEREVKILSDGTEVAKFSLATTEVYRAKDGRVGSDTQWHTVVLWRGLAGLAKNCLKKGSLILLEGRIRYRAYEDKDGNRRQVTEIVGDQLIMLDRRNPVHPHVEGPDSEEEPLPF